MARFRLRRPSASLVLSIAALVMACAGTAVATTLITGDQIKDGSITGADIANGSIPSSKLGAGPAVAGRTLRGPRGKRGLRGKTGPQGAAGAPGAAGAAGAAGTARAAGFVDNSSGTPGISQVKGGVTVRRSGNGVFCLTAPGIDPTQTPIVVTQHAKSTAVALVLVGSGLGFAQQCTGTEFQVLTIDATNFNNGLNTASFDFVIP
jgi:hypothetical protein